MTLSLALSGDGLTLISLQKLVKGSHTSKKNPNKFRGTLEFPQLIT
jgi:hypothetical protein